MHKTRIANVAEFARIRAAIPLALVAALVAGCSGGADTEPTVVIKPRSTETTGNGGTNGGTPGGQTQPGDGGAAPAAGGTGTLTGRVVVTGALPNLPPLVQQGANIKDAAVCAAQTVPDESVTGQGEGLANVFIYLEKAPSGAKPAPPSADSKVIFDQKGCRFLPHALIARVGSTVQVLSDDAIAHNTHTFPVRNDPFNSVIKPNDREGVPLNYTKAEKLPLQVKCDFHAWMVAWHLPLDHPYAAVSKEDGSFEIPDLPAGKHEFRVWHEKVGYINRAFSVNFDPSDPKPAEIKVESGKLARKAGPASKVITVSLPLMNGR